MLRAQVLFTYEISILTRTISLPPLLLSFKAKQTEAVASEHPVQVQYKYRDKINTYNIRK